MRRHALLCMLALIASGCAAAPSATDGPHGPDVVDDAPLLHVASPHIGDLLRYNISFEGPGRTFIGATEFRVLEQTTVSDAYGASHNAIHLRQAAPGGGFGEEYYIDAKTFRQIKLERLDTYNDTAHLEPPTPNPALPPKTSYANATGLLERYAYDPFFEDANFFGVFATGTDIHDGQPLLIDGNLWERNGTAWLMGDPVNGTVSTPTQHPVFGPLRTVDATVAFDQGENYQETITWNGDFAATVPFAVRADRTIKANFFGEVFDVRFTANLGSFVPGTGAELRRDTNETKLLGAAGERASWEMGPADGSGEKLAFPLSEAIAALGNDPTAIQYFQAHPGHYLYFGEMLDIETCKFYPSPPPGCHWLQWDGLFFAPDDWMLWFTVEKYASGDDSGVVYAPIATREYMFESVFSTFGGAPPQGPPDQAVVAEQSTSDLPERATYPSDALTVAGAIKLWKAGASASTADLRPNDFFFHLTSRGYEFMVDNIQWEFPKDNPEFFPAYDNMPLELPRHRAEILPDGFVVEQRNWDVTVEHR